MNTEPLPRVETAVLAVRTRWVRAGRRRCHQAPRGQRGDRADDDGGFGPPGPQRDTLPVEKPPSTLHRLLEQYTSYMQLILVGVAVVSLIIAQWGTAIALFAISLFNAVGGLRQQGKAESAMNALQEMMRGHCPGPP